MEAASGSLAETDIHWDRLDKTRFHVIGGVLFTAESAILHPMIVVKTRMQVTGAGSADMHGFGIQGLFRGFGTNATGSVPSRVLEFTSFEVSKQLMLKAMDGLDMSEATHLGIANGVAGMLSNLVTCVYDVPLDVVCQRLMVQGVSGMTLYNGPFDVVRKILRAEGFRGLYRGFGITAVTLTPVSALWWGSYGTAQYGIWRGLGFGNDSEKKPSELEMVTVQAAAGTIAGGCSSIISAPIDTIKTRLQVMDNYGGGRPSVIKTTEILLQEDGWRGFFRGLGPRSLNMSLLGTLMIVTYELTKRMSLKQD